MERYGVSFRNQSECVKIRLRKTPNTDTSNAVIKSLLLFWKVILLNIIYIWLFKIASATMYDLSTAIVKMCSIFCSFLVGGNSEIIKTISNTLWNGFSNCTFLFYSWKSTPINEKIPMRDILGTWIKWRFHSSKVNKSKQNPSSCGKIHQAVKLIIIIKMSSIYLWCINFCGIKFCLLY